MKFQIYPLLIVLFMFKISFAQNANELYNEGLKKFNEASYDEAYDFFTQTLEKNSGHYDAIVKKAHCQLIFQQYEPALKMINEALDIKVTPEAYLIRAKIYIKIYDYKSALNDLNKSIDYDSKYIDAYTQRAFLFRKLNDPEGALNDFNLAILYNSLNPEVYYNRAELLFKTFNQKEKAIKDYSKAIELNPEFKEAYFNRGICQEALKNYKEAVNDYNQAMKLGINDTLAFRKRAKLFFLAEEYPDAISDFTVLINKFKIREPEIYYFRGLSHKYIQDFKNAVKDFNLASMLDPLNVEFFIERANSNLNLGKIAAANTDLKNAELINPKYFKIYELKGDILVSQNEYGSALTEYDKAIELKGNHFTFYKRACCFELLEDTTKACEDFKKALKLGNKDAENKINTLCN